MEATGHCFANNMVRVFAQAGHGGQKFSLEVLDTHKRGHCLRMKAPVLTTREMSTDSHTTREQFTSLSEEHNLILLWPTHNKNEREKRNYNLQHRTHQSKPPSSDRYRFTVFMWVTSDNWFMAEQFDRSIKK